MHTTFAATVSAALKTTSAATLASRFQVAVPTVLRWASGIARPHPRIQTLILKALA